QEYFQFFNGKGDITGYAATTRKDGALSRYKAVGLLSHLVAQKQGFMQWLRGLKPVHCIFVRIFDDTNVYVTPEAGPAKGADVDLEGADLTEEREEDEQEQQPVLGCKRGRTGRRKVQPLLGMLQWAVARRSDRQRAAADAVESVQLFAPSQVMPKANAATLLDRIGKWMLPGDEADIASNAKLLKECSLELTEEQLDLTLQMLNTDWCQPLDPGEPLRHYCAPGCCASTKAFRLRMRAVLDGLFAHLFACPLLYRWKNFDEACTWVARGMVIRGLLKQIWGLCKQDAADNLEDLVSLQAMDEDNPDMNPSLRQQVRVAKVMGLLSEPDAAARFLKTLL
ncbi:unnamed protein product, partial [Symbiodinium necroappetens]